MLTEEIRLCSFCLVRQGVSKHDSKRLGVPARDCELCKGAILNIDSLAKIACEKLAGYEFSTFLVGTTLPQGLLDKEDEIRSHFKIRGREGIKAQITRSIGKKVAERLRKRIDYARPDVTLLVSLADNSVSITSRSIWVSARYTKNQRGLAQRSSICRVCSGIGCAVCNYRGASSQSIQSIASDFFKSVFQAEDCNFIWVGSEGEKSLVDGVGRPFYVEVVKPKKRTIEGFLDASVESSYTDISKGGKKGKSKILPSNFDLGSIHILDPKILSARPTVIPQFSMKCLVYLVRDGFDEKASTELEVKEKQQEGEEGREGQQIPEAQPSILINEIESKFLDLTVQVRLSRRFKIVNRKINSVLVRTQADDSLHPYILEIDCDGGIPIRKLVSGIDDTVMPNLSPYIKGLKVDPDQPFDILEIKVAPPAKSIAQRTPLRSGNIDWKMKLHSRSIAENEAEANPKVEEDEAAAAEEIDAVADAQF